MHSGFVGIVGRPNVGKSTLLNRLLGKKLSITSRKPQTTRHRILGVKTTDEAQYVFIDTPGIHSGEKQAINRYMNRAALSVLNDVDVILFLVDGTHWTDDDQRVLSKLKTVKTPVVLVVNKLDKIKEREDLLPFIEKLNAEANFAAVIPLSALKGEQVPELEQLLMQYLPDNVPYYSPEQLTDRGDRFIISEVVREKVMRFVGDEVPYATTAAVESLKKEGKILKIGVIIWVERDGQKAIIIGKGGEKLKQIGKQARLDLETFFEQKIFLQLWVKVKSGWSNNEKVLNQLGYDE